MSYVGMVIIGIDDEGYQHLWRPGHCTVIVVDNLGVDIDTWSWSEPPETIDLAVEQCAEHLEAERAEDEDSSWERHCSMRDGVLDRGDSWMPNEY